MFRIRTFMLLIVLVALPALLFAQEQAPAETQEMPRTRRPPATPCGSTS